MPATQKEVSWIQRRQRNAADVVPCATCRTTGYVVKEFGAEIPLYDSNDGATKCSKCDGEGFLVVEDAGDGKTREMSVDAHRRNIENRLQNAKGPKK